MGRSRLREDLGAIIPGARNKGPGVGRNWNIPVGGGDSKIRSEKLTRQKHTVYSLWGPRGPREESEMIRYILRRLTWLLCGERSRRVESGRVKGLGQGLRGRR